MTYGRSGSTTFSNEGFDPTATVTRDDRSSAPSGGGISRRRMRAEGSNENVTASDERVTYITKALSFLMNS